MLALGVRILANRREAEDVLHDVFLEVWKRAGDYDPRRGSVKTWLFLRMRSRCLDRLKSAGFSRSRSIDADGGSQALGAIEAHADRAADSKQVRSALDTLPDDQRAVLLLGYYEGLSCSEIADKLGIPLGTVKSRAAAAMSKLRAQLGEDKS